MQRGQIEKDSEQRQRDMEETEVTKRGVLGFFPCDGWAPFQLSDSIHLETSGCNSNIQQFYSSLYLEAAV